MITLIQKLPGNILTCWLNSSSLLYNDTRERDCTYLKFLILNTKKTIQIIYHANINRKPINP